MRIISLTDGLEMSGNPPSAMKRMKVVDVTSIDTVQSFALAATPQIVSTTYGTLYRSDIRTKQTAFNQWSIEIPYGPQQTSSVGDWSWDFDTTGGTVHITQAREEVSRYPSATAPDQQGAIAVDDGEVRGTEIVIPAMKINVRFRHPQGQMSLARAKQLANLTGTVNSTPMLEFEPGECLFLGARGANGSNAETSVDYSFAMAANESDRSIGGIAGVAKKGWEVAWIRYEDTITTADGKEQKTRTPKFVYVDRVYEEVDLATLLGFGG